jgi:hypothetical protein
MAALASIVGGLLWSVHAFGWTFTHGSSEGPRNDTILGLDALWFTMLIGPAATLFVFALAGVRMALGRQQTVATVGYWTAMVGAVTLAASGFFGYWIVDPNQDFGHPLVQGGWLLYLVGLFPILTVGMLSYGSAAADVDRPTRSAILAIGLLAPLPIVGALLGPVSSSRVVSDLVMSSLIGAMGLGWVVLGVALWRPRD